MQKQLVYLQAQPFVPQTVWKEYEEWPDCGTDTNISSTVSTIRRQIISYLPKNHY